jgi:glycosyltransferase involved in cell wall biosynthesis
MNYSDIPVTILLSTHNGAKYLPELLESLLQQTHKNWQLLLRDDCSKDSTQEIIAKYQNRYSQKIKLSTEVHTLLPLGAAQSFSLLLQESTGKYFMFADQDDIWQCNKISISLERLIGCEKQLGSETPILVHTDLSVVNDSLASINPSYMLHRNLDPDRNRTCQLLLQNIVTGCTTCFNQSLKELVGDIPATAPMHDWWLALIASCFGTIEYINQTTINYRQHSQNTIGAPVAGKLVSPEKICKKLKKLRAELQQSIKQAQTMLNRYEQQLTCEQKTLLRTFASINNNSALKKRLLLAKYNIAYNTFGRNVLLHITI